MKYRSIIVKHVLIWLAFISYELAFLYFTVGIQASFLHFVVYYGLNITLFYVNAHVILNFSFFKTRAPYVVAIALITVELFVYLVVKYWLDFLVANSHYIPIYHTSIARQYLMTNIWRAIYFMALSIAYWSTGNIFKFREKNHRIETEQLKTVARNLELENKYISVENAYLQNQISPHLLFNSLNFIYNTVHVQSKDAGEGVMLLSDLMRYSLVSADDTRTVLLREEVAQVDNLVKLCRMRFGDEFYLRFRKKGKLKDVRIIPLILITLVENMMKHGDLGNKRAPAEISLLVQEDQVLFETSNRKRNTSLYPKGGLGLKNMEKRLHNYYQEQYTLVVRDVEDLFTVTLTLTGL